MSTLSFFHYLVFSSLLYIPISFVCSIIWWMAALVFVGMWIATYFISRIAFVSMLYNFAILRSKILKFIVGSRVKNPYRNHGNFASCKHLYFIKYSLGIVAGKILRGNFEKLQTLVYLCYLRCGRMRAVSASRKIGSYGAQANPFYRYFRY